MSNQAGLMIQFGLTVLDAQSDMLSFVGEEAIAHAAGIFATLTAAFAFATGFINKCHGRGRSVYILSLSFLLSLSAYLAIRLISYGSMAATVAKLPAQNVPLSTYWNNVSLTLESSKYSVVHYGITSIFSSIALSWLFGYEFANCITVYLVESSEEDFGRTLRRTLFLPATRQETLCMFALWFFLLNTALTYGFLRNWDWKTHGMVIPIGTLLAIVLPAIVVTLDFSVCRTSGKKSSKS